MFYKILHIKYRNFKKRKKKKTILFKDNNKYINI